MCEITVEMAEYRMNIKLSYW